MLGAQQWARRSRPGKSCTLISLSVALAVWARGLDTRPRSALDETRGKRGCPMDSGNLLRGTHTMKVPLAMNPAALCAFSHVARVQLLLSWRPQLLAPREALQHWQTLEDYHTGPLLPQRLCFRCHLLAPCLRNRQRPVALKPLRTDRNGCRRGAGHKAWRSLLTCIWSGRPGLCVKFPREAHDILVLILRRQKDLASDQATLLQHVCPDEHVHPAPPAKQIPLHGRSNFHRRGHGGNVHIPASQALSAS